MRSGRGGTVMLAHAWSSLSLKESRNGGGLLSTRITLKVTNRQCYKCDLRLLQVRFTT